MKSTLRMLWIALLSMMIASKAMAYELINLNFGPAYTGMAAVGAPVGSSSDFWNYVDYPGLEDYNVENDYDPENSLSLLDAQKKATGVSLTAYEAQHLNHIIVSETAFPGNTLMNSYAQAAPGNTGIINFTGLTPGTYKIYVYSQNENNEINNAVLITANSVSFSTVTSDGLRNTYESPYNYAVATVTVGADTNLSMTFKGYGTGQGDVNGIQIVPIEAVPEPGSVILVGIGGIILARIKSRSKALATINA